jgi:hypothetical protein
MYSKIPEDFHLYRMFPDETITCLLRHILEGLNLVVRSLHIQSVPLHYLIVTYHADLYNQAASRT